MTDGPSQKVQFHYIKSTLFRVAHVDGAIGGVTPSGLIHCAVYSERPAIPQITEHPVEGNVMGEPEIIQGRTGIVRELEIDLMMSREKAAELRDWLSQRISEFDSVIAKAKDSL
jgi:hypothetical protein